MNSTAMTQAAPEVTPSVSSAVALARETFLLQKAALAYEQHVLDEANTALSKLKQSFAAAKTALSLARMLPHEEIHHHKQVVDQLARQVRLEQIRVRLQAEKVQGQRRLMRRLAQMRLVAEKETRTRSRRKLRRMRFKKFQKYSAANRLKRWFVDTSSFLLPAIPRTPLSEAKLLRPKASKRPKLTDPWKSAVPNTSVAKKRKPNKAKEQGKNLPKPKKAKAVEAKPTEAKSSQPKSLETVKPEAKQVTIRACMQTPAHAAIAISATINLLRGNINLVAACGEPHQAPTCGVLLCVATCCTVLQQIPGN